MRAGKDKTIFAQTFVVLENLFLVLFLKLHFVAINGFFSRVFAICWSFLVNFHAQQNRQLSIQTRQELRNTAKLLCLTVCINYKQWKPFISRVSIKTRNLSTV